MGIRGVEYHFHPAPLALPAAGFFAAGAMRDAHRRSQPPAASMSALEFLPLASVVDATSRGTPTVMLAATPERTPPSKRKRSPSASDLHVLAAPAPLGADELQAIMTLCSLRTPRSV